MVKKIPFTAQAISQLYLKLAIPWINNALNMRDREMKELAPTDTGEYERGFKIDEAQYQGTKTVWANVNDSDHAFGVEFGFRKTPVNRHKWPPRDSSTVIYNGIGAKVMTRTVDNTRDDVLSLITQSINEWLNR